MSMLLRRLVGTGFRRGVLGGSRAWTTVTIVAVALRILGAVVRKRPERIQVAQLRPGDRFEIRARQP